MEQDHGKIYPNNLSSFFVKTSNSIYSDYLEEYNLILNKVRISFEKDEYKLASPTLSKQETITELYESIVDKNHPNNSSYELFKAYFQFIPKLCIKIFFLFYIKFKSPKINFPKNALYFRSWLEPRCLDGTKLIDEHFRDLPSKISSQYQVISALHAYSFQGVKKFYSKKDNDYLFIIPQALLTIKDIFFIFLDYLRYGRLKTQEIFFYKKKNVTKQINRSLLLDFLKFRSLIAFEEKFISQKLLNKEIKAFIYVFENQAWEKVCCKSFSQDNTKTIGVQGSGFSPLFLNFFNTPGEELPEPDVILTVGDNFTKFLRENCNIRTQIKTFFSLRFNYDTSNGKYNVKQPISSYTNKILYSFSVNKSKYSPIIEILKKFFEHDSLEIHLRFHPQYDFYSLEKNFDIPKNFKIINQVDVENLRFNYDFVLFNDNSFGIESLMQGVKSFQFFLDDKYLGDRFFYFNEWNTKLDPKNIKEFSYNLINKKIDKTFDTGHIKDYINNMYTPDNGKSAMLLKSILKE
jgi:hypothetical protein